MVVLIELLLMIIALLVIFLIFHKKDKHKNLIYSIVICVVFIISILLTIFFATPLMEIDDVLEIEVKNKIDLSQPKTIYLFKDLTSKVKINGVVDYNKVGSYEINYEVSLFLKNYSKKQIIKVIDTIPPEITLNGNEEIINSYNVEYEELGAVSIDNADGDISDKIIIEKKEINSDEFEVIYTSIDSSGNKSSKIRKISLIDNVPPTIALNGNSEITIIVGNPYKEQGATAIDEKDGDLTSKIQISGSVDTSRIGEYNITYKVSDSKGNEAIKTRKVRVRNIPQNAAQGIDGENGVIYLTFDDGPSTSITPKILDILNRRGVKATFFILNYDNEKEQIIKREYAEGHTVAIHGYSHDYKSIYKSVDAYMENITKLREKIKNSLGYDATITRFPGGSSNTVSRFNPGIMSTLTLEVLARGYRYFDWNVSSGDAGGTTTATGVYNNVIKNLSKSRINVVLMHDFNGNYKTLNALENIIDYGIDNGYTFSAITLNTPMITHSVNN